MIVYIGAFEARVYIDDRKKKVVSLLKKIEVDIERDSARLTAASIFHEIYESKRIKTNKIIIIVDDSKCVLKKFELGVGAESKDIFKIAQMETENLSVDTNKYHFINYEIEKNNFVEGISTEYFNLAMELNKIFASQDIEIFSTYGLILAMFIELGDESEDVCEEVKLFNIEDRFVVYKKSEENDINIFRFKDITSARIFAKNLVSFDENITKSFEEHKIEEIDLSPSKFIYFIKDKDNRKLLDGLSYNQNVSNKGVTKIITAISIAIVIMACSLTFFEYQRYLHHKKSLEISQNANERIKNRKERVSNNGVGNDVEVGRTNGDSEKNQKLNIDDLLGVIDAAKEVKITKSTIEKNSVYLEGESKSGEDIEKLKNSKLLKNGYVERIEKVDKDRYKFIIVK